MRSAILILAGALFGATVGAVVTDLEKLVKLRLDGQAIVGEVLRTDAGARGDMATIRISFGGRPIDIVEPCGGIDCHRGAKVPVTVLSGDLSTRAVGDLGESFGTALLATFLIGPLLFGFASAYSLARLGMLDQKWTSSRAPAVRMAARYLPAVMSLGVLLSSLIGFLRGERLPAFQPLATALLVFGSIAYVAALRGRPVWNKTYGLIAVVLFSAGAAMLIADWY